MKISKRKEIIKIRAEINEIEVNKRITKTNENKADSLRRQTKLINFYTNLSRKKTRKNSNQ